MTTRPPRNAYVQRDAEYLISVTGLKPSSRHYFYFEGDKIADGQIRPEGQAIGQPIISDGNGKATFTYFHNAANFSSDDVSWYYDMQQSAGTKIYIITTENVTRLTEDFRDTAVSWAAGVLLFNTAQYNTINQATGQTIGVWT